MKSIGGKEKSVAKKPKLEPDDREQSERFIEEARKISPKIDANKEFSIAIDAILGIVPENGKKVIKGTSRKEKG